MKIGAMGLLKGQKNSPPAKKQLDLISTSKGHRENRGSLDHEGHEERKPSPSRLGWGWVCVIKMQSIKPCFTEKNQKI
jgi:hypothetical protein